MEGWSLAVVPAGRRHDEYRAVRVVEHVLADRSEHEAGNRPAATLADDDQLGVVRLLEDRISGRALDEDALDVSGSFARDRFDRRAQSLLGRGTNGLAIDRADVPGAGHRHRYDGAPRMHRTHPGAAERRLVERELDGFLGGGRAVDADDDHQAPTRNCFVTRRFPPSEKTHAYVPVGSPPDFDTCTPKTDTGSGTRAVIERPVALPS